MSWPSACWWVDIVWHSIQGSLIFQHCLWANHRWVGGHMTWLLIIVADDSFSTVENTDLASTTLWQTGCACCLTPPAKLIVGWMMYTGEGKFLMTYYGHGLVGWCWGCFSMPFSDFCLGIGQPFVNAPLAGNSAIFYEKEEVVLLQSWINLDPWGLLKACIK